MRRKVKGCLYAIGAVLLWFFRGTIESWFFDKILQIVEPHPRWSDLVEYGPPAVFAGVALYLLLSPGKTSARQQDPAPFDLAQWTNLDSYFVWAAACLWVGVRPEGQIPASHPAYPALQMIKGALDTKLIASIDGGANMAARVTAEELRKLAFARQQFPKFLFPDDIH
jgi:hypothetical protein